MESQQSNMIFHFLRNAIFRHFEENRLLLNQISNNMLKNQVIPNGRTLGELLMHMIRSLEYYARGLAMDQWEALTYDLEEYPTIEKIWKLYEKVIIKIRYCLENLYLSPAVLFDLHEEFNRPATKAEILLEMLEHSIQHRGQITVYLRLQNVEPSKIPYII